MENYHFGKQLTVAIHYYIIMEIAQIITMVTAHYDNSSLWLWQELSWPQLIIIMHGNSSLWKQLIIMPGQQLIITIVTAHYGTADYYYGKNSWQLCTYGVRIQIDELCTYWVRI